MTWKQLLPLLLGFIFFVAAFTRFWNISGTLQFLGDQGRDAIIVADIFTKADLVFIGPVTSVGNMYLGPLYYYFMVPFLWLTYPSPVGPAYAVAVLGILSVVLTYYLGKELLSEKAALVASALFAISSTAITFSRFSWNPNPAPFVSLIMIYATYKAWKSKAWWWVVVSLCFSILIQLHYLTLLSAAGAGIIWILSLYQNWKQKKLAPQLLATLLAAVVFILSLTPLILFDARHNWLNSTAFSQMLTGQEETFTREESTLPGKLAQSIKETHGRSMHILTEITIGKQRIINTIFVVLFLLIVAIAVRNGHQKNSSHGLIVLAAYLFSGIVGTSVYEHSIFDHYIAYLFPVAFLILGFCLDWLWQKNIFSKATALVFVLLFLGFNLPKLSFADTGWTISDMKATSQTILERVEEGEKYNIVLLSETGDIDGQNYRYFLQTSDKPPVRLEQRGEVETLFIINEDRELAKVTDSPVYEIVVFPDKEPKDVYTIPNGPEITVLSTRN